MFTSAAPTTGIATAPLIVIALLFSLCTALTAGFASKQHGNPSFTALTHAAAAFASSMGLALLLLHTAGLTN